MVTLEEFKERMFRSLYVGWPLIMLYEFIRSIQVFTRISSLKASIHIHST
jgi:hypothetical protein